MTTERDIIQYNGELSIFTMPEYICPIHGNIGSSALQSTLSGLVVTLCLHCYIEKLIELGVQKVELKNG